MNNTLKSYFLSLVVVVFFTVMAGQMPAGADGEGSETKGPPPSEDSQRPAGKNTGTDALTRCQEPKPQICTREFRPVCAQMQDGSFKTYSTGCTSCTNPNVVGYRDGACE